jgi:uncharacterized membrane protein
MAFGRSAHRKLVSREDEASVVAAIRAAESATSGEIRVHIEARSGGDPLSAARRWFVRLKMHRTALRNGILFYVAVDERAFAVVGDEGIHAKVGPEFWETLRDILREAFTRGEYAAGLRGAIAAAGEGLSRHFPHRGGDRNELPDGVSRG